MITLTAIVPIYNEEKFLEASVNRLLKEIIFDEIFLIDDCSTDNSKKIAQTMSEKFDIIKFFQTPKNSGKGFALSYVKSYINTSHVVIHDADLEYFPSDLNEMLNVAQNNKNSLILGSRFVGNKDRKNIYFRTQIANRVMSAFFSYINSYKVSDVATCYKLMPSKFFKDIDIKEKGFSIEIELLTKFLKYNKSISEVPIAYEGRTYAQGKKIKTKDGFQYLFNTIKYRFFS